MIFCPMCDGLKIFKDLECECLILKGEVNLDCTNCGGSGVHDLICSYCRGRGEIQDSCAVKFSVGPESRNFLIGLQYSSLVQAPEDENHWEVDLFADVWPWLREKGMSSEDVFWDDREAMSSWEIGSTFIFKGKKRPDDEAMRRVIAVWIGMTNKAWRVEKRKETFFLFSQIQAVMNQNQKVVVSCAEGTMGTGEMGWSVYVEENGRTEVLGVSYEVNNALHSAFENIWQERS